MKRAVRLALSAHLPVTGPSRPLFRALYRLHVTLREAWIWSVRFFWYEPLFRSQCNSVGTGFRMEQLPYIVGQGKIEIGDNVYLSGKSTIGFGNRLTAIPEFAVGEGTFIGHMCAFSVARSIRIGSHCLIAGGVHVQDQDGHPLEAALRRQGKPVSEDAVKPVVIGDDVWIGAGAIILKGVSIGDRSIVGARSVVTRDVPPDVVTAGNPARVVKNLVESAASAAVSEGQ